MTFTWNTLKFRSFSILFLISQIPSQYVLERGKLTIHEWATILTKRQTPTKPHDTHYNELKNLWKTVYVTKKNQPKKNILYYLYIYILNIQLKSKSSDIKLKKNSIFMLRIASNFIRLASGRVQIWQTHGQSQHVSIPIYKLHWGPADTNGIYRLVAHCGRLQITVRCWRRLCSQVGPIFGIHTSERTDLYTPCFAIHWPKLLIRLLHDEEDSHRFWLWWGNSEGVGQSLMKINGDPAPKNSKKVE